MLEVCEIGVSVGATHIISNISFTLSQGEVLMVIGPNGSGKTTMVRAIMNALPHEGKALICGQNVKTRKPFELARQIAVLTQTNAAQFAFTAREVVAMGRYCHKTGLIGGLSRADEAAIDDAMERTRTAQLSKRLITTLSGGELQRVCLARVLAQDPAVLILDEPTNHLDIEHQISLFDIIAQWARRPNRAALAIVHDLNLAYSYGDKALLLHEGKQIAYGEPAQVLTRENLRLAYNVDLVEWMQSLLGRWQDS